MGVRPIAQEDEVRAIDAIVLGFVADPMTRWVWPCSHQYLAAMPRFVRAFGGPGFEWGGGYCTSDFVGAALWLPPEVHPDEERLDELMESTAASPAQEAGPAIFKQMATYHPRSRTGTCHSLGWILRIRTKVMAMRSCCTRSSGAIATSCPRTSSPRTRGMCPSTAGTGSRHSARYRPAPRLHSCRCCDVRVERLFSRAGNRRPA